MSAVRTLPTPTPWPTPPLSEKQSYEVVRGTMTDALQFNGQVVPVKWEPLAFAVEGELAALLVQEGDAVAAGALLAELAMPTLHEELAQAQLTLEQAQDALRIHENRLNFDLERAQLELQRAELLRDQAEAADETETSEDASGQDATVALRTIDVELATLRVAEIEAGADPTLERTVTQAQLAVEALERQVEDHRLRAPFAGVVVASIWKRCAACPNGPSRAQLSPRIPPLLSWPRLSHCASLCPAMHPAPPNSTWGKV